MNGKAKHFVRWAGGEVKLSDLTADRINEYLVHLENGKRLPNTVRGYRTAITSVLRFARWKPEEFEYVRKVKIPRTKTYGWNLKEVEQLLAVASAMAGRYKNGVNRSDFWMASILSGFSTGLRWGDLTTIPVEDITESGRVEIVQSKTGRPVSIHFSKDAIRFIRAHGQPTVLPCPYTQKWFCEHFARLVERAEIRRGSFKWLRRTAGSYADLENRGDGRRLLGHSSDAIFDEHYNVKEITESKAIQLPTLDFEDTESAEAESMRSLAARKLKSMAKRLPRFSWKPRHAK